MPDANSYAINLELSLDDKITSKLNRVKDSILNLDKDAVKSASKLNKTLYTINELQRLGADNVQALRTQYAKVAGITEDQLQQLLDLAKAQDDVNKLKKIEGNLLREANKEYDEMIQDGLEKIRVNTEIWKGRSEAVLGVLNSMGGSLSGLIGLGQEWSKTISTTSNILKLIDRFFLAGIKKRTSMSKKLYDIDMDGTKRTYQWKTKVEKQFIQSVLKSRKKQAKDIHKISMKELGVGGGAGGKGPGGPSAGALAEAAGAGGGGAGSVMAFLASSGPYIAAAMVTVGVALGAVVGSLVLLNKSLQLASEQFESFHTINYLASGGAQVLADSIFTLGLAGVNTTEELQKAANAIASLGYTAITASGQVSKNFMAMTNLVANYTRATGIAEDQIAQFINIQRGLGNTFTGPGGSLSGLYNVTLAMKKYGLTTVEASTLIKSATDITYRLSIIFNEGAKAATSATAAYLKVGAAAKQLGLDVAEAASLINKLSDNMLDFIVATSGRSLQGPIDGLAAIVENINNIEGALPEDPLVRDILLKNVYKINEKDLAIAKKLSQNFDDWREDLLKGAESQEEIARIQKLGTKDFLTAMKETENAASEIEKMARESNNNINRQWDLLKSMALSILGKVGTMLMPYFVDIGKVILNTFASVYEWFTGAPIEGIDNFSQAIDTMSGKLTDYAKTIDKSAEASYKQVLLDESALKLREKFEAENKTIDDKFIATMKRSIDNKELLAKLEGDKGSRLSASLYDVLTQELKVRQESIEQSSDLDFEKWQQMQQTTDAFAEAASGLKVGEKRREGFLDEIKRIVELLETIGNILVEAFKLGDKFASALSPAYALGKYGLNKAMGREEEANEGLIDSITGFLSPLGPLGGLIGKPIAEKLREPSDRRAEEASMLAKKERESKSEVIVTENGEVVGVMSKTNSIAQAQLEVLKRMVTPGFPFMDLRVW